MDASTETPAVSSLIDADLLGHKVIVSFGTCNVVSGKFMEIKETGGIRWAVVGRTKTLIPFPVKEPLITKFVHYKFECSECKR